jgi:hypothetical protein
MKLIDLLKEVGTLAGYNVTGTDAQAVANKARATRRVNQIRADIASRYAGRWQNNYREGWLPLSVPYSTGTVAVTQDSRTVTGTNTVWTSDMQGRLFLGPNNEYYRIASVTNGTTLLLTEPYQSVSVASGGLYQIWQDTYDLYPEVFSVIDFVNYSDPQQMTEDFTKHGRGLFPRPTSTAVPRDYSVVGKTALSSVYSTGTVSVTINTTTVTGVGTTWLGNIKPGYEITIGVYTYTVREVNTNTSLELYQLAVATASSVTYTSRGRNMLRVKFLRPTVQQIVQYSYYAKSYSLMNDSDEDCFAESYPHVILDGVMKYDFLDKNDPVRAGQAAQLYENSIKNAHMSDASQYGGTAIIGLDIPDVARE